MHLPFDFIERTKYILGNEWNLFEEALQTEAPISIRLNKKTESGIPQHLEKVPWCENGYFLPNRPFFTFDPLFHAGAYYVQEASSMFVEHVVKQTVSSPITALDLCAAPGGKSTLLSSALPKGSLLVSNEIIRQRAHILSENLQKWGETNNVVTCNKPKDFGNLNAFFNLILIDAPCSGEGMFRKDPESINEWSLANVALCANRQREIVSDCWSALKENGILIYSTCTYNREENEENIDWIIRNLDAEKIPIAFDSSWGITETDFGYHFFPHKTKGEGFFICALKKCRQGSIVKIKPQKNKSTESQPPFFEYLKGKSEFTTLKNNSIFYAIPKRYEEEISFLQKELYILHAGISLAELKGRDFIPQTGLALSSAIDKTKLQTHEVGFQSAIAYLQKNAISINDAPKGYVLICYKKQAIGWVKNLGNRCNNLYPNEWRIRSQQTIESNPNQFLK